MHQIQYNDTEQHAAQANIADHPVIHLLHHYKHGAPAIWPDERQHSLDNKYHCDRYRKYLPKVHMRSWLKQLLPAFRVFQIPKKLAIGLQ